MKKRIFLIVLSVLLLASLVGNFLLYRQLQKAQFDNWIVVNFSEANSRPTYFSLHKVADAHKIATGKGVRVGVLDWGFGYEKHTSLYAGGKCFTSHLEDYDYNFNQVEEHGLWMATTLKEIAPDCEVFALGTFVNNDEAAWVDALEQAIDWALENQIQILTMSHQQISTKNSGRLDAAVNKAVAAGIITTFIHYENPNNLLPYGFFTDDSRYSRLPDINIWQYDYNSVFVPWCQESMEENGNCNYAPFLSVSSTSPVLGGFAAILREIDPLISPADIKQLLAETSYQMQFTDPTTGDSGTIPRVADIGKAAGLLASTK